MLEEIFGYSIQGEIAERRVWDGKKIKAYKAASTMNGDQVVVSHLLPYYGYHMFNDIFKIYDHNKHKFLDSLYRETERFSRICHSGVANIIQYGIQGNDFFIIEEYIDGVSLDCYIRSYRGAMPEDVTIKVMSKILMAVEYMHCAGIMHKHINPFNIVLSWEGQLKIIGLCENIADELVAIYSNKYGPSSFDPFYGTRKLTGYESYEEINGEKTGYRSDIYSAGKLLFYMVSGTDVIDITSTNTDFDVAMKIVKEPLPKIRNINPAVSKRMQEIVEKATAITPELRYQSCKEFLDVLTIT